MNWIIFRFLLVGPAVGTFAFVMADQLLDSAGVTTSNLASPGSLAAVPILSLYGLVFAYPVGGVPAAICGAVYAILLRHRTQHNPVALIRFLSGGLLGGCVISLFSSGLWSASQKSTVFAALFTWAAAGLLGGGVSALAVGNNLYALLQQSRLGKRAT